MYAYKFTYTFIPTFSLDVYSLMHRQSLGFLWFIEMPGICCYIVHLYIWSVLQKLDTEFLQQTCQYILLCCSYLKVTLFKVLECPSSIDFEVKRTHIAPWLLFLSDWLATALIKSAVWYGIVSSTTGQLWSQLLWPSQGALASS